MNLLMMALKAETRSEGDVDLDRFVVVLRLIPIKNFIK
jgi:hypothetical protein